MHHFRGRNEPRLVVLTDNSTKRVKLSQRRDNIERLLKAKREEYERVVHQIEEIQIYLNQISTTKDDNITNISSPLNNLRIPTIKSQIPIILSLQSPPPSSFLLSSASSSSAVSSESSMNQTNITVDNNSEIKLNKTNSTVNESIYISPVPSDISSFTTTTINLDEEAESQNRSAIKTPGSFKKNQINSDQHPIFKQNPQRRKGQIYKVNINSTSAQKSTFIQKYFKRTGRLVRSASSSSINSLLSSLKLSKENVSYKQQNQNQQYHVTPTSIPQYDRTDLNSLLNNQINNENDELSQIHSTPPMSNEKENSENESENKSTFYLNGNYITVEIKLFNLFNKILNFYSNSSNSSL
jgi:hypothetical protein